jgi:hypothetical protein
MNGYGPGVAIMIAGALLIILGRLLPKRPSVHASKGSVAVGGQNIGSITNINSDSKRGVGDHSITIIAILVEIVGIAVMIWHVIHLSRK